MLLHLPWLALLGWFSSVAWFLCDDAFISFRYVRNLLEGHGLVFNPGEYVEGYSSFLWVLELSAIWGLSGVAPERAKAGFTALLSGLRSRLAGSGVHVVTVKPGFVYTRMTDGMDLPARLTATPEEVATAVVAAIRRRRDVIYVRRVWRPIMFVLRAVPERLFKRMSCL